MKSAILFLFTCFFNFTFSFSQKPVIDYLAIKSWPAINFPSISNDGRYVLYSIKRLNSSELIIHSVKDSLNGDLCIPNVSLANGGFTEDNNFVVFIKGKDTLSIFDLNKKSDISVPNCLSFKISKCVTNCSVAYLLKNRNLVVFDLKSGLKKIYSGVFNYEYSSNGSIVASRKLKINNGDNEKQIILICPDKENELVIAERSNPVSFVFDNSANQLAFVSKSSQMINSIWYYKIGMDSAIEKVDEEQIEGNEYNIGGQGLRFSANGDKLFFKLTKKIITAKIDSNASSVDIWNYKDRFLQPNQQENIEGNRNRTYGAVINISSNKIFVLDSDTFRRSFNFNLNAGNNDDYLLAEGFVNTWESYRLPDERPDLYLVNTSNGNQTRLFKKTRYSDAKFSPGGKFVYWYNKEIGAYFTYNLATGRIKNCTSSLPAELYEPESGQGQPSSGIPYGIGYWMNNDKFIFIYDKYDIWQVDPNGLIAPRNITRGYGRSHNIAFRLVRTSNNDDLNKIVIINDSSVLLCGFNLHTKENGFFEIEMVKGTLPKRLIMSSNVYYWPSNISFVNFSSLLLKAKNKDVYLITRMNSSEFPNLTITKNFKEFSKISNLQPNNMYNWMTSELIQWRTFDNRPAQGILYKPESFDPKKKYPVIFSIYESLSAGLNKFIDPNFCNGAINIPLFISRGYLVICPDIHYVIGEPGWSAYNYVVSCVKSLGEKPWVNLEKVGIQGHSFGAYQVNDIITRTSVFAAAASAEGATNLTSYSGTLKGNVLDGHAFVEKGQPRMGLSLWNIPDKYINNSPVFKADKISTPLLIMHNKNDFGVPWTQGIELFTALRRLNKKVWMLQYDNGQHELFTEIDKIDYTKRLIQYFDCLLKDAPNPKWMSKGVKAEQKRIDSGFELEALGNTKLNDFY